MKKTDLLLDRLYHDAAFRAEFEADPESVLAREKDLDQNTRALLATRDQENFFRATGNQPTAATCCCVVCVVCTKVEAI